MRSRSSEGRSKKRKGWRGSGEGLREVAAEVTVEGSAEVAALVVAEAGFRRGGILALGIRWSFEDEAMNEWANRCT